MVIIITFLQHGILLLLNFSKSLFLNYTQETDEKSSQNFEEVNLKFAKHKLNKIINKTKRFCARKKIIV